MNARENLEHALHFADDFASLRKSVRAALQILPPETRREIPRTCDWMEPHGSGCSEAPRVAWFHQDGVGVGHYCFEHVVQLADALASLMRRRRTDFELSQTAAADGE